MSRALIFGLGYSARVLAKRLHARGWHCTATVRSRTADGGDDPDIDTLIGFDDAERVLAALRGTTHIISTVPPGDDGLDPVLARYGEALALAPALWVGYLSSTGVYADARGAWIDESAAVQPGRRPARLIADQAWQALRGDMRVFRLPGIYGPGRSALDRVTAGNAHRVDAPDQLFSRIHVDDLADALLASFAGPAGVYNIADDAPSHPNAPIELAAQLLAVAPPPMLPLSALSPGARAFYGPSRRIANHKAKRLLGWTPRYRTYRDGLMAIMRR